MWAALTLAGHSGTVRCLHLHNNRLVSGSSDRTIKVGVALQSCNSRYKLTLYPCNIIGGGGGGDMALFFSDF